MALPAGTRIGSYDVIAQIGVGGMGEVYRATDTTLGREVALKVLPTALAQDADRLTRLEREAKTLAAVNHPNIAAIYALEKWDGTYALVMELVEGPTLADQIALGPVSVDEALAIARQIAEALEVAHERGIVHRDLKPANVKIRADGTAKVLDFGLAKATDPAAASLSGSHSPTITTPARTEVGAILGTAAYMSPEQARGQQVDKRADIWAFGLVLYEMLTGKRLFDEPTVSDTLAAVLKGDMPLDALPRGTPASVKHVIGRCLTRDWRRRLRDIGEARIAIEDAIAHPNAAASSDSAIPGRSEPRPNWRQALPWAVTVGVLATAGTAWWAPWREAVAPLSVIRLAANPGADVTIAATMASNVVLSPDGRLLAFAGSAAPGERPRLFVRGLDQLEASPLAGTEGARHPFFSPDGLWIGFFAGGKLRKAPVSGGAAVTLCDAPEDRGGSWSVDGSIVFTPSAGESPLFKVSADGGTPEPLTTLRTGELTHRWPQVLPGGRAVLYTASVAVGNYEAANLVVQSIGGGEPKMVLRGGYYGRYLPAGYLLYVSQGKLFAAPFDLGRLEIRGQASPVLSTVTSAPGTGGAQFSFSQNGSLVYMPIVGEAARPSLFWVGRDGRTEPLRAVAADYQGIRFSPDGERLAMAIQQDIWVYEWRRDLLSRLTSHPLLDADPVWTPDGQRIAFRSTRDAVDSIYWQRADGTGSAQRLSETKLGHWPSSWHPSGKFLAFRETGRDTAQDIWILPMEGNEVSGWKPGQPKPLVAGRANERDAVFSPDGRWLAYQSDESGMNEVYVSPFPGPGSRWQVSTAGGLSPQWSRNGRELFFRTDDGKVMVATYSAPRDVFQVDKPRVWFEGPALGFDVHPDGQRVAVVKPPESASSSKVGGFVFIFNFPEELRRVFQSASR